MNYTQSIGNVVELKCIAKFIEMGYEVSIPYGMVQNMILLLMLMENF